MNELDELKKQMQQKPEYQQSNEEICAMIQSGRADLMPVLFCKNSGLINLAVRRYTTFYTELDAAISEEDLQQSTWESMVKAVKTYDPGTDCKFSGWFYYYLQSGFLACTGKRVNLTESNRKAYFAFLQHDSLDRTIDDADETTIADFIPDPASNGPFESAEERLFTQELHAELQRNIDQLPELQQAIITGLYFGDTTQSALAQEHGISFQWVSQQHRQALQKLKATAMRRTGDFHSRLLSFIELTTDCYSKPAEAAAIHRESTRTWALNHRKQFEAEAPL